MRKGGYIFVPRGPSTVTVRVLIETLTVNRKFLLALPSFRPIVCIASAVHAAASRFVHLLWRTSRSPKRNHVFRAIRGDVDVVDVEDGAGRLALHLRRAKIIIFSFTYHPQGSQGAVPNECTSSCRYCMGWLARVGRIFKLSTARCEMFGENVWVGKLLGLAHVRGTS